MLAMIGESNSSSSACGGGGSNPAGRVGPGFIICAGDDEQPAKNVATTSQRLRVDAMGSLLGYLQLVGVHAQPLAPPPLPQTQSAFSPHSAVSTPPSTGWQG